MGGGEVGGGDGRQLWDEKICGLCNRGYVTVACILIPVLFFVMGRLSVVDPDPHGSAFIGLSWIRIRIQEHEIDPNLLINLVSCLSKSLTRIRIRMAPHGLDADPDPH